MNTVWLLISPVVLLMNSAVTNIGAEKVMSLSLHSSTEYLGGSNRWSRNDRDMVPEKSSIGLISSKISSRPDWVGTSLRPACRAASTRAFHFSLPSSQSKDSVCRARRSGTSSGSWMRAKETRRGPAGTAEALREAANRCPSEGSRRTDYTHARQPRNVSKRSGSSKGSAKGQCSRTAHACPLRSRCMLHVGRSIARLERKRQARKPTFGRLRAWTLGFLPCVIWSPTARPKTIPANGGG